MKLPALAIAAGLAMACATPARASVLYTYDGAQGSFRYTSPGLITALTTVPYNNLDSCNIASFIFSCYVAKLNPAADTIEVDVDMIGMIYFGFSTSFAPDAISTYGKHVSLSGTPGTLTVAQAVPEPAGWTLTIAGAGLAGAAMRRRERRAATWPDQPRRRVSR